MSYTLNINLHLKVLSYYTVALLLHVVKLHIIQVPLYTWMVLCV